MRWLRTLLFTAATLGGLIPAAQGVVPQSTHRSSSDWQPLLASAGEVWEYDASSIRRDGPRVQLWLRVVYAEAHYRTNHPAYRAVRTLMLFDCNARSYGERESVVYADPDFRIVAFVFSRPSPTLAGTTPDTIGAAMLAAVCGR